MYNIEFNGGEIENALAEQLQGFAVDQKTFVNTLLARYHKNLYEWKEDVIRSRLQMAKLCRSRVQISEDDIHKRTRRPTATRWSARSSSSPRASEARPTPWPITDASAITPKPSTRRPRRKPKPELAATAGKVRPFGRYVMGDENFDRIVFRLSPMRSARSSRPSMVRSWSSVCATIPADTSVRFESVRDKLAKELADKKVVAEMQTAFDTLKKQAVRRISRQEKGQGRGRRRIGRNRRASVRGKSSPSIMARRRSPARISASSSSPVTAPNRSSSSSTAASSTRSARRTTSSVTPQEIEAGLGDDLKKLGDRLEGVREGFSWTLQQEPLEWREDVVRPRLLDGQAVPRSRQGQRGRVAA